MSFRLKIGLDKRTPALTQTRAPGRKGRTFIRKTAAVPRNPGNRWAWMHARVPEDDLWMQNLEITALPESTACSRRLLISALHTNSISLMARLRLFKYGTRPFKLHCTQTALKTRNSMQVVAKGVTARTAYTDGPQITTSRSKTSSQKGTCVGAGLGSFKFR